MKKSLAIVLAVVLVMSMAFTATSFAAENYPTAKVSVNGNEVKWTDMEPVNISGMVFVPIRETLEAFGQTVEWEKSGKGTIDTTDKVTGLWAKLSLSSQTVVTRQQGVERTMEMVTAPKLIKGKTMVSIRALTDIYGKTISYDNSKKTVVVSDYNSDMAVLHMDIKATYEGNVGDVVKVHVAEDGTYTYFAPQNKDFIYLTKEAEGVGGHCMYFKAVTANKNAAVKVQKKEVETDKTIGDVEKYKASIADPCEIAKEFTTDGAVSVKAGEYVKVTLEEQAASTGYSWFITGLPAGMILVEDKSAPAKSDLVGAPNERTFVFKVTSEGIYKLTFDLMRSWEMESQEQVVYTVEAIK